MRVRQYSTCGSVEFGDEREAKLSTRSRSIESGSVVQLVKRARDNNQLHFRAARTLASASSIGMT
jgi:hypothetical protein